MKRPTRREAMQSTAAGTLAANAAGAQPPPAPDKKMTDTQCVEAAGLTAEEAACWEVAGDLASKFFALPQLHPMDKQEVATAIHVIQHKLLARPTYRKYLEMCKAHKKE